MADMARKERRERPDDPMEFVMRECYDETAQISFTFGIGQAYRWAEICRNFGN